MRLSQLVVTVEFFLVTPAWVVESAAAAVVNDGSIGVSSLPAVQQRMNHDQAEVARLQREVARQESASRRASWQLRQQDRQIAELQRQLSSRRGNPTVGHP